tara:strand:- start:2477 stop:2734 length:258 start_codon:yes stop_codon:yes gene_type:complete
MEEVDKYLKKYVKYKKKYIDLVEEIEKSKIFSKGEKVYYIDASGNKINAEIKEVHFDDIEPYYSISIDGNNDEKQTVRNKLQKKL